jgi:signal transduction histidine kinase
MLFPNGLAEQTFLAFLIGGMCTAPLVSFSYYLPAFLAYVIPSTLPLAGRLALFGSAENAVIGDMILVFTAAITLAAYSSSRAFTNLLRLNLNLARRTEDLSTTNTLLEGEIAQRRVTEAQLHQAQKMEAIGQLTGGIAHDFNNLLTGVIGHLDMACRRAADNPQMIMVLQAARRAAERGAALTRQLLAFARKQYLEPQPVDVSAVVDEIEKMLKQTIGPSIRIAVKSQEDLAPAWVDPNQLELAILNLALNGRDAMPNGGDLHIDVQNRHLRSADFPQDLAPGDYVIVSVTDTGTGMNDTTLAHAFEPFFTTKGAGRGSGLGLSMVQGFAVQSGGWVQINTVEGQGTRVDLWLPRVDGEFTEDGGVELDAPVVTSGQARILVCDDDNDVRAFVVAVLRDIGFSVWEANGPSLALEILSREQIDLLLADYAMPEMTGVAVMERARASQPGLKTLLMTGYAEILRSGRLDNIPRLEKPFKIADLTTRIDEILNGSLPDAAIGQPPNQHPTNHKDSAEVDRFQKTVLAGGDKMCTLIPWSP